MLKFGSFYFNQKLFEHQNSAKNSASQEIKRNKNKNCSILIIIFDNIFRSAEICSLSGDRYRKVTTV